MTLSRYEWRLVLLSERVHCCVQGALFWLLLRFLGPFVSYAALVRTKLTQSVVLMYISLLALCLLQEVIDCTTRSRYDPLTIFKFFGPMEDAMYANGRIFDASNFAIVIAVSR